MTVSGRLAGVMIFTPLSMLAAVNAADAVSAFDGATQTISRELFTGMLVIVMTTLASLVASVVQIVKATRRQPPTNEVLQDFKTEVAKQLAEIQTRGAETYATRAEVVALKKESSVSVARIHDKIEGLKDTVQASFRGLERTLGIIEGQLKEKKS